MGAFLMSAIGCVAGDKEWLIAGIKKAPSGDGACRDAIAVG
ncbi:hypothetical protein [Klebsiella pneumoniae IS53]|nr:hypothetical protein [Klebsiella pneumoniae IS53]